MEFKAAILDLDNTLYEYDICNKSALEKVFEKTAEKFELSREEVEEKFKEARKHSKIPIDGTASSHSRIIYFKKMIEAISGKTMPTFSLELHDIFWEEYFNHMKLKPEAKKFLDKCKEEGKKIVILTDLTTEIQLKKIKRLGIEDLIHKIVTSEEVGKDKPAKGMFEAALEAAECEANQTILVGDDEEKDILAAEDMGIKAYSSFEELA